MTPAVALPPCPWCLGRRVPDHERWPATGWGCSSCGAALGLQLEPIPRVPEAFPEHPLTGALDGAGCPLSPLDVAD